MSSRRPFRGGQRGWRSSSARYTGIGMPGLSGINQMAGGEGSNSQNSGRERSKLNYGSRLFGFRKLLEILNKEPDAAVVDLNRFSHEFTSLVAESNIRQDLLILLIQIIGEKFCSKDLNLIEIRNPLLAKVCAIDFLKQLKALTYVLIEEEHVLLSTLKTGDLDKSPFRILKALHSFYHVVWLTMPTLAADHFVANIEAAKIVTKTIKISTEENDPSNKAFSDLESELTSLKSNIAEYLAEQQKCREDKFSRPTRKSTISKGEIERLYMVNPPEDFRTLSVAPQKDELRSVEPPFLRPSIEKGSYPSSDVYLDVQFRLLREDFVQPLREGIQDYMRYREEYSLRRKKMPFGSVRVYRDVKFVQVKLDGDMTVYSLKFCMDGFKNIKWEKSKRLLTGSLLCLTPDNFQSIYLAIVVFRRIEDLSKGMIDVIWEGNKKPEISQNSSYLMMECEVYYEAYRHTLSAMQSIALDKYPMKKYIVYANNDDVPPPLYLQQTNHLFNFDSIIIQNTENSCENDEIRPDIIITHQNSNSVDENTENISLLYDEIDQNSSIEEASSSLKKSVLRSFCTNNHLRQPKVSAAPLDLRRWPTAAAIGMDESQYSAFQNAITRELSVIQGPPGTGKTYIELQLPEITPQLLAKAHVMQTGSDQATMEERWAIYFYFVQKAKKQVEKNILLSEETIFAAQKEYQNINTLGEAKILRQAKFVGMTTTGAAKYNTLLRMMRSRIVIVEEAAEVMEAHIVTSITDYCQHLILIGDHKQLRPSTNVYKLAKDYNLDVSLFERLINNNISSCQLRVQHRMRPNICKLLVPTIYKELENHSSVLDYPRVLGTTKSLFFLTHAEPQLSDDDSATKSNPHEAKFLIKLCRYFILQGYKPQQITILTTYLGQMFLLKKLNSVEGQTCSGVRITVVDNFQGEENDIILLSLVRSNPNNNIGFLKTDNRICVALSRAKHGMFIMANMECLIGSGSSTWQKINRDLQNENNVGTHLELQCEVHGDITLVQNAEDFAKVPEGGCSQMCKRVLSCEHVCQSVCHSWDRDHKKYQCKFPCSKKCENEHECPKECFKDCGNCYVIIDKALPCGHVVKLQCYMPPSKWGCMILVEKELPCGHKKLLNCKIDPATIKCHEEVEKILPCGHNQKENCYKKIEDIKCKTILQEKMPTCEHEVKIECFKKYREELWKCYQACDIQLICGHTCDKICHFENDPNHENHVCKKICGRTCLSDHTCRGNHECRYECPNCDVLMIKTLPCGHQKELKCFVEPDSVICQDICDRELACGHSCLLKCHEDCRCTVNLKRPSIDCSHEVGSMCFQTPSREFCEVRVNAPVLSPCGHQVTIPCKIEVTGKPEEYLSYCDHPCDEVLGNGDKDQCGHKCTGNCFKCFQGRIHKRCEKKCGRSLACGHICKSPCAALCPSCNEKCFFNCEHSKCPKQCGFPCVGCNEPCGWACSHARCNKLCREKCDRESCDKPCTVVLKCKHSCIGLCGEVCPPLCRICDAEEVQEILFGDEDEEDARFVYLEDCKHAIEVRAMDQHMTTVIVENGVSVKKCPKCNTVIRNSRRYHSILSEIRKDIVSIKRKIQGVDKNIGDKLWTFVSTLHGYKDDAILQPFYIYLAKHTYSYKTIKKGKSSKSDKVYLEFVDQYKFESLDHMIAWWIEGKKMLSGNNKLRVEDYNVMQTHFENFFELLTKRPLPLSQREINDFAREFGRVSDWFKLYRRWAIENISTISGVSIKLNQLSSYLTGVNYKIYTSAVQDQFNSQLQTLDEMIVQQVETWKAEALNVETRRNVFRAVGFGAQHWHKCPNGHFYVIADCGQPNQASQCPECKLAIGASKYHVLAQGNTRASENDIIAPTSAPSVPDVSFLRNADSNK